MLNQHKFKTNNTNPWNQFKIVVTVTVVLGFLGIIFFPILACMHCLKKTLMALSKERVIKGIKVTALITNQIIAYITMLLSFFLGYM